MNLVIVESPAKAKTINKYLGNNYTVLASYGHIRDLPSKNGSVDPDDSFKMKWEVDSFSKKYLKEITDAAKDSSKIILATDPDREGEAIAWHVKEYLNEKKLLKDKEIERVVFNEITKKAVIHGIENPRQIEPLLVDAYMARRALDYLVGFNISPILWTKLPGSKSAGRVQSVALKLITEREHEIESFKPEEFWTLSVKFTDDKNQNIIANISQLDNNKIEKFSFRNKDEINKAISSINKKKFNITDISSKVVNRNPSGPFTTSTLQQTGQVTMGSGGTNWTLPTARGTDKYVLQIDNGVGAWAESLTAPEITGTSEELELINRAVAQAKSAKLNVAHVCVPQGSGKEKALENTGFSRVRTYLDMLWSLDELPELELPTGYSVRPFEPGDTALLTSVQNDAFTGSWGFCPNTEEQIEYRIHMPNTSKAGILFLLEGVRPAGYCWTVKVPSENGVRGMIGMVGVMPDYRGKGMSRHILQAGMKYLRSAGMREICLEVDEGNNPAVRLYKSIGFKTIGERHWFERLLPGT